MQIPNPNYPRKSKKLSMMNSSMDANQLMDSLTSHISLYHSSSSSTDPNPNPRSSILKWFSSLTIHQRQAYLTVVDLKFIQILIQMQGKLRKQGHGFFIILPDMPSTDPPYLPGLCFRKSHGLLARVSESNGPERSISDSIRLFNSKEGERIEDCSCLANCLDSMTVSEDFVGNVDRFVEAMDGVSNRGFLRGEVSGLGSDWVELDWLKAKGYYSMEALTANRLEVALRLSWLNCNVGKKRGAKSKEKVGVAGVAANVYWRKKGCIDWWAKLDAETKTEVLRMLLGKAAKSLTADILKGVNSASEDEMWLFSAGAEKPLSYNCRVSCRRTIPTLVGTDVDFGSSSTSASIAQLPSLLACAFNRLFVLQDILALLSAFQQSKYDQGKLFFSSLCSLGTISDCISRKIRALLMLISLDCTKHELLEEGNLKDPPKKSKEKPGAASHRKKGKTRTKRVNAVPRSSGDDLSQAEPPKDHGFRLADTESGNIMDSNCLAGTNQKVLERDVPSSAVDMENGQVSATGTVQIAAGERKKKRNKNKRSGVEDPVVVGYTQMRVKVSSSDVISEVKTAKSNGMSDKSTVQSVLNDISIGDMSSQSNPTGSSIVEENLAQNSQGECSVDSVEKSHTGSEWCESSCRSTQHKTISSRLETVNNEKGSNIIPHVVRREVDDALSNEAFDCGNAVHLSETDTMLVLSGEATKAVDPDEKLTLIQERKSVNGYDTRFVSYSGCPSHEWPTVAPFHFPSMNPHIPAATDRLHLDVGHNWHNHFYHSFVPMEHQGRNSSIENGGNRILSRPLPMSLDWPPMVRSVGGLAPSLTRGYDSKFMSRRQSSFQQGFTTQSVPRTTTEDEMMYFGDFVDLSDAQNSQELADELDNHWISEEEYEVHTVSGKDYNQYFGGGVMYWNPSDHPGTSFSRPPSLSSDDSSWAWREADISRAVDDMVAFSSSYSTNGLTSPSAVSFCSPFDPLGSAHQALSYVIPGSEVTGKVMHSSSTMTDVVAEESASGSVSSLPGDSETKTGDSLPYPILRPIIVPNMARERSRSDFKHGHDHKSPCVPPNRRDPPRIKRPPSPVVLCVPHAPRPPPPSPVSDSRKHRGFPTVRSGSSSPRHWGVKGWFHDGINFEEACVRVDGSEVVWPSWRNKILSAGPMIQPLPGALLQDRLIAISQLARDQEHPDVAFPLQPPELLNCATRKASLSLLYSLLHDEIDSFCKQVAAENMIRKPYINWAVKRVTRSLQVLWPRSRTNIFGSNATGLSLPTSDVDLVVCLPPVRNLEPIKEAGILEGRNGIKETCLQHAARYLANQEWVKNDSLKIVENTAIPIIMLVVEVPHDLIMSTVSNVQTLKEEATKITGEQCNDFQADMSGLQNSASPKSSYMSNDKGKDGKTVRIDISFKSPSHTGLQTTELVRELTEQFPAATPLALVLKQFLADRTLDQSYSGGLSSYCLVLLIIRFLQHEHHFGRPINQNFGCLLMDFLYFFGNVFDPRQMRISVQGSGVYINRERGYSIDPIYIDDPLFPANNVGRNCFRIHQCIKAFADAYSILENELVCLPNNGDSSTRPPYKLLPKIIPSISIH